LPYPKAIEKIQKLLKIPHCRGFGRDRLSNDVRVYPFACGYSAGRCCRSHEIGDRDTRIMPLTDIQVCQLGLRKTELKKRLMAAS